MARVKFDYFDAMVRQGKYAQEEAHLLIEVFKNYDPQSILEQRKVMHAIENAADVQVHELFKSIATEFLTPIDREDIAELAHRLDDVADYIDDVLHQLYMYDIKEIFPPAIQMAELIEKTTAALVAALEEFKNFRKSETLRGFLVAVNDYEEEADAIYSRSIRELYTQPSDNPVFIMAWSNIFLRMERCVDSCENLADIMATIALKNT
jgi:uncharacterized protein Yka (UPF0111/DUF47 family)